MIGAPTRRASAARRSWQRRWTPALAGLGVVALAATACGSPGTTATTPAPASGSPRPASSTQPAFPGVAGTAAAVSGSSMEVQNPTSGQVTVTFSSATVMTETVAVTSKDLTVGSCVAVVGQPSASGSASRSVTATTVTVSKPVNGKCTAGFGGFGGGGPRGTFSPPAGSSPRPRPTFSRGSFGGFGGANGKVTSLSASGFVVQGRNPAAGTNTSITVTTTAATRYLTDVTAHPSALKVGECITAIGSANSIGSVAARRIQISQPGPNGCVTGFGRHGGGTFPGGPTSNA